MRSGSSRGRPGDDERSDVSGDPLGLDEASTTFLSRGLRALVPRSVANRALAVSVSTDRSTYRVGDPVEITVRLRNRCPLPVSIAIDGQRVWSWTVDGLVGASDEPRRAVDTLRELSLRGFETREFTRTWDGRFKRTGSPTRWIAADPGEYEIGAFVDTTSGAARDTTTIELRQS